ncbi:glycosyltransferase family 4 protein [Chitinophaga ginsengisoli]|uniref:Glycosyltransferase involved in cell wall biosynthesis n=1 Tax=Chitinophaga ginsengisoli TaxID=363837 RepID=A0A2P8FDV9_9BACT|nr:glycosyltransferase family 4 protein [Chitinophaga ginsengisoli]PSL19912.1 glycosyltransferase involved in cell wall biosynthesis [Chitinophaga ginsengisoli]
MKIAVLSPIVWRTPPRQYGPWEQVTSVLTEGLVKKGIDVTLFATGDSVTRAKLSSVYDHPLGEEPADFKVWECLHISALMERAGEFDLIHNNYDFLPLTYSRLIPTPMLTTIHGFSSPDIIPVYKKYNNTGHYVSISNSDRSSELRYIATVYNGIDTSLFPYREVAEDYLLSFGRIHPEKGTHLAIEIARKLNRQLVICGLIQDARYFTEKVEPFVNGETVIYKGNVGPAERCRILGNATALLHPVLFEEPFGLSIAEAMMCGTPVIAFNRGAMKELILEGTTGFLVNTVEEAVAAVGNIPDIHRHNCHLHAMANFSQEQMVNRYIEVYKRIVSTA